MTETEFKEQLSIIEQQEEALKKKLSGLRGAKQLLCHNFANDPFKAGQVLHNGIYYMKLGKTAITLNMATGLPVVNYYGNKCRKNGDPLKKSERLTFYSYQNIDLIEPKKRKPFQLPPRRQKKAVERPKTGNSKQVSILPEREKLKPELLDALQTQIDITRPLEFALEYNWSRIEIFRLIIDHQVKSAPCPLGCSNIVFLTVYGYTIHVALYYRRLLQFWIRDINRKDVIRTNFEFKMKDDPKEWNSNSKKKVRKILDDFITCNIVTFNNILTYKE